MKTANAFRCHVCHAVMNPAWSTCGSCDAPRQPEKPDWYNAWRELAALTDGITDQDPRFSRVMAGLDQCDNAFRKGNWPAFQQAAEQVRAAVQQ